MSENRPTITPVIARTPKNNIASRGPLMRLFYFFVPKTWIALRYHRMFWVGWFSCCALVVGILWALAATEVMECTLLAMVFVELSCDRASAINFIRLVIGDSLTEFPLS
jgi:hypothetical protein